MKMILDCQALLLRFVHFGLSIAYSKLERSKNQKRCLTNYFRIVTIWGYLVKTLILSQNGFWGISRKRILIWH